MVTGISIKIGDKTFELNMKEAEQLHNDLNKIFGHANTPIVIKEVNPCREISPCRPYGDPCGPWVYPSVAPVYPYAPITTYSAANNSAQGA